MKRSLLFTTFLFSALLFMSCFSAHAQSIYTAGKTNVIATDAKKVKRFDIRSVGLNPVTISIHKSYSQVALVTATVADTESGAERLASKLDFKVSALNITDRNWEQVHITTNPGYYEQTPFGRGDVYNCSLKTKKNKVIAVTGACYTSIVLQLPVGTEAEVFVDGTLITSQIVPWTNQELVTYIKNAREDADRFKIIESHIAISKKAGLIATLTCAEIKTAVPAFDLLDDRRLKGFEALLPMTSDRENLDNTIKYLFTSGDVAKAREMVRITFGWSTVQFLKALDDASFDKDKMNVVNAHLSKNPPPMTCEELKTALNEFPFSDDKLAAFTKLFKLVSDRESLESMINSTFSYFDAEKARKIAGIEKKP